MHFIIDGYNLIFQVCKKIDPLQNTRESITALFQTITNSLKLNITIVFDSHKEHSEHYASKKLQGCLEVIFPPDGETADNYILEILELNPNPKLETLVTSDKPLALKARGIGAKTQSVDEFLAYLMKKLSKTSNEEKQHAETPNNFKRLQKIFEKKLQENSEDLF
ncbi:MAG: NYN domain-containing protein [Simkaniaceae bacterium]|nr:NYN domain-containing protein [Simkaniaceae bacterium]